MTKRFALIGVAIVVLSHTAVCAAAQPLEAKAGVVSHAATTVFFGGTCASFPINISSSGSYVLPGNINMPCNVDAINVKADNVVIDLGGYTIKGTGSGSGIGINGPTHSNVTVKNGSVIMMGGGGIVLGADAKVEEITASYNGGGVIGNPNAGNGLKIDNGIVDHVQANGNALYGIQGFDFEKSSVISNNTVDDNQYVGILAGAPSQIFNNTASRNGNATNMGGGIFGVGTISNNTVESNGYYGIYALGSNTSILGNTISNNPSFGIVAPRCAIYSYGNNQLYHNNETPSFPQPAKQVFCGVQMGPNICDGILCP